MLQAGCFTTDGDVATWADAGGRCCEAGGVTGAGEVAAGGWLSD